MDTVRYLPTINSAADIDALPNRLKTEEPLLVGEYGSLNPLAFATAIRNVNSGKKFYELILRNKNRELVESCICTAAAVGFDGVVIASGAFNKSDTMGKPVYDLDQAQALLLAISLRRTGKIPSGFALGVRSAGGNGAVRERNSFYLREGADFILITGSANTGAAAPTDSADKIGTISEL